MSAKLKEHQMAADVIVVGAGPAGLTAALALAEAGLRTVLLGRPAPVDNRTTALLSSSVLALETLGIWQECREHGAPLKKLRIIDDTRRLFRAPESRFSAEEIGLMRRLKRCLDPNLILNPGRVIGDDQAGAPRDERAPPG